MKISSKSLSLILLIAALIALFRITAFGAQDPKIDTKPEPAWTLLDILSRDETELRNLSLKISKAKSRRTENRVVIDDNKQVASIGSINIIDNDKEIGFLLLDIETGLTEIIKGTKRGRNLFLPDGYNIRVVRRINGIEWNFKNTHFHVISPRNNIVLKIVWPNEETCLVPRRVKDSKGRTRTVTQKIKCVSNVIYSPYSADDPTTVDVIENGLHTPELVERGTNSINDIFEASRIELRTNNVRSRAFPEYIAGDVPFINPKAHARIQMTEHMDLSEFNMNPQLSAERVLVILGANPVRAFSTCNSAKKSRACGMMQFTDRWRGRNPGTYSTIVRRYPNANLIKSFPAGAFDHVNVAMAAILLHDINLAELINEFGEPFIQKIKTDPVFTELILSACYNGAPRWVQLSLRATRRNNFDGWVEAGFLRTETHGYIRKEMYLIENNLP